jgi:phage baseplate assembly protein W
MHNPAGCPGCEKRAKLRYESFQNSLRAVLSTKQGREVMDFLVDRSGVHSPSLWEPSARLNYVVARRDFGMEVVEELVKANSSAWFTMLTDRFTRAEAEQRLIEAEEKKEKK